MNPRFDELEQTEKIERVTVAQGDVVRLHGVVDRDLATPSWPPTGIEPEARISTAQR